MTWLKCRWQHLGFRCPYLCDSSCLSLRFHGRTAQSGAFRLLHSIGSHHSDNTTRVQSWVPMTIGLAREGNSAASPRGKNDDFFMRLRVKQSLLNMLQPLISAHPFIRHILHTTSSEKPFPTPYICLCDVSLYFFSEHITLLLVQCLLLSPFATGRTFIWLVLFTTVSPEAGIYIGTPKLFVELIKGISWLDQSQCSQKSSIFNEQTKPLEYNRMFYCT